MTNGLGKIVLVPRFTKPVWVPKRGNFCCNRWDGYGIKISRDLILGSDIEYSHWICVEADPRVVWYCEQPIKMLSLVDGKNRGSYIDMYILWDDGTEVFRELKTQKDMNEINDNTHLKRQIEVQEKWCKRHGIKHEIITDEVIYANKLFLKNWKTILTELKNFKFVALDDAMAKVMSIMNGRGPLTIKQIALNLSDIGIARVRVSVFRLIHSGFLVAPLDRIILSDALPVEERNYGKR